MVVQTAAPGTTQRRLTGPPRPRTPQDARQAVLARLSPTAAEVAQRESAAGRVLASDVRSAAAIHPHDNAAMNGYVIVAARQQRIAADRLVVRSPHFRPVVRVKP